MNRLDSTDTYHITTFRKVMKIAPIVGLSAAMTFTFARMMGFFAFVDLSSLIGFDLACLSYFIVAYLLNRMDFVKEGELNQKAFFKAQLLLCTLIIVQWNLITYIFPTRSFWGYAPMFVLLSAFHFQTKVVAFEVSGISVSIIISWILIGDKLLPIRDELFAENLILRIVALVVSFSVIIILTYFAEKFTVLAKKTERDMYQKNIELEQSSRDIIDFAADIIEQRDVDSGYHVKRLKNYVNILASQFAEEHPEYGLDAEKIEIISMASALHDIGKICIPDSILLKPARLTADEFEIIKSHTVSGALIIDKMPDSIDREFIKHCRDICLYHHERFDGKGYPKGLKGENIPISAQLVAVVDCFDALTNERPYKAAIPGDEAIRMILDGECGVFSERMMSSLRACSDKLIKRSRYK